MAAKIKLKTIKATSEDPDIASIFSEMMNGNIKIDIVHKKYDSIKDAVVRFNKLIRLIMLNCNAEVLQHVEQYCDEFSRMIEREFNAEDIKPYLVGHISEKEGYKSIPEENRAAYIEVYKRIKDCQPVNAIINTLHEINSKRKNFVDENKDVKFGEKRFTQKKDLNGVYLIKHPDPIFAPVCGLPSLNLKDLYLNADDTNKEFVLKWIQKLFIICYDLYEATNIPDIDPNDMVEVVLSSIDQVKKHIPRCEKAFNKIRDSVSLLKDNFGTYYSQFVESNNPSIIIESFIGDVSNTSGNDPALAREFKQIINFYKKMVLQNKQFGNSKVTKLFSHVEKQFKTLSDITGEDYSNEDEDFEFPSENLGTIPEAAEDSNAPEAAEDEEYDPNDSTEVMLAQQNFMSMLLGSGKELTDEVEEEQ